MRFTTVKKQKKDFAKEEQPLPPIHESSDWPGRKFPILKRDSMKRIIGRFIARPALSLIPKKHSIKVPFSHNHISIGGRFAKDASTHRFLRLLRGRQELLKGLVVGCGGCEEDIQFWLRREFVSELQGIDLVYDGRWTSEIVPALEYQFGKKVFFQQAALENMPFADNSFDFVCSEAVLEHVRDLHHGIREICRVMKPGAYTWHGIGPLYFSYGGDHCIGAYGFEHGYDHLLKDDAHYQRMINDQSFFDSLPNERKRNYWAKKSQFSYCSPVEYMNLFKQYFQIVDVILVVPYEGLKFRSQYSEKWLALLNSEYDESAFLIGGLYIIMQKKSDSLGGI